MYSKWILTDAFDIKQGIRQDCLLFMLLFIISRESLCTTIESSSQIKPFITLHSNIKLQGYADDTNFILSDDQSIKEAFEIVRQFESATAASLNLDKTKLFGIGLWKQRTTWPITNAKVKVDSI